MKRPNLLPYEDGGNDDISKVMLGEAEICEALKKVPHPNVTKYLGCQVEGRSYHSPLLRKV